MLIVCVLLCIICVVVACWAEYDHEIVSFLSATLAGILFIAIFIMSIFVIGAYAEGYTAKHKIEMYQEENTKIETQMNVLVKEYMNYEQETFAEFKTESTMTLVSLFPELKSDELVQQQMKVYVENNNKIKGLKESLIDMKLAKWLLYFGK